MFARIIKEGIIIGLSLFVGEMVVRGLHKAITVAQEKRNASVAASKKPMVKHGHKKSTSKAN